MAKRSSRVLKKIKLRPIAKLKKDLDKIFSEYIRRRDRNKCFTCEKQMSYNQSQAGHYIRRNRMNTRWDEQNVHCQCVRCNVFLKGNYPEYARRLVKRYGEDILEDLSIRAEQPFKLQRYWLEIYIGYYKEKVKALNERG